MTRSAQTLLLAVTFVGATSGIASAQFGIKVGGFRVSTNSFRSTPRVEYNYQQPRYCPPPKRCQPSPPVCRQPAPAPVQEAPVNNSGQNQQLRQLVENAKSSFQNKKYLDAVAASTKWIELAPKSTDALQLRSLSYFAMGEFKLAARDAYTSILTGPIWTRVALKELYTDASGHTRDLSWLRAAADEQPQSLHVHFLLAYHNLLLGNLNSGAKNLETVLKIKPNEPVASRLLQVVSTKLENEGSVLTASR